MSAPAVFAVEVRTSTVGASSKHFRCTRAFLYSGFTLVEMLVAVALFAIASALAFGGLGALTRARSQLDAENERLGRLQFAVGLLERDLRGVAARAVRDGNGAVQAPLTGTRDRLELSRHGLSNALALPRATIERVGYRLEDGVLQRQRYAVLDRTGGSGPSEDRLLDRVEALEFTYLTDDGREVAQWPPPRAQGDAPPRAVAVTLRLPDYGELRRVLELPEAPAP
jgi:general secretion pathway protein J